MIFLHIPLPPTLNSLYPGKFRRTKSKEYQAWIRDANTMLNNQHFSPIKGLVQVRYILGKPRNNDGSITKKQMDVFNREKAIGDLLTSRGVIEDDSKIERAIIEWGDIDGADLYIMPLTTTIWEFT